MKDIQIIEQNNQRVLTTAQIATAFGTDVKIISNNFNRNKDRFKEGKHHFVLTGDALRDFKTIHQNDEQFKHASIAYLWTEKGAWMHAKSLNTDEAWDAYEALVDDYYNRSAASSPEDMIIMMARQMKETRLKAEQATQKAMKSEVIARNAHHRIDSLDATNITGDLQQRLGAMVKKYAANNGITFSQAWKEFRAAYNTAFRTNITARIENYQAKHGLKSLTCPQYLSIAGELEDAIRVADKMLNQTGVLV